ncbi:ETC complex I subunit conserved region-domain-containing protein [Powellomyces hirtus]|nr:ETC complex I subunit conserved region-domain-containing protein [Powellomyces hirtus]
MSNLRSVLRLSSRTRLTGQIRLVTHTTAPVTGRTPAADTNNALTIPNPPGDNSVFEADACSGAPVHVSRRTVHITRPGRTATQQGTALSDTWHITFDPQERWENPLMGWATSHDPVQGLQGLEFKTRDEAIRFALRQGYEYTVEEPKKEKFRIKTYADNFKVRNRKP